jgi:putative transposase
LKCFFRQFRREVTHNELFQTVKSLLAAARNFFDRYNREPSRTLSVIGSYAHNVI